MNILILNWRDIKNPCSGGAEILTHEIAKYWVKKGHTVTQFSSSFPNCKDQENFEGVKIIRRGHPDIRRFLGSVHIQAFIEYVRNFRGKVDVVIDEIHGVPFYIPLYVKEKKIALICEVADGLWFKVFGKVYGFTGWIMEKTYLKIIYKNILFLTISNSTKEELEKNGVNKDRIHVLKMGIHKPRKILSVRKEKNPTLIFVGRVTRSKGAEDAIKVLDTLKDKYPSMKLWLVGRGDSIYLSFLKKTINKLKLTERVTILGYIDEEKKFELLGRAWILIHPSQTEGWGINVIEANSVGTPAIGYNISGLKDSIQHGKTGILTSKNFSSIAKEVDNLLRNMHVYKNMVNNAKVWAKNFYWDDAGEKSLKIISSS